MSDVNNNAFEEKEFASKFDWGIWKKMLGFAGKLKMHMVILGVVMVFVAVLDGIFPQMTRYAIDTLIPALGNPESAGDIWNFVMTYGVLALMQGANVWGLILIAGIIEVRMVHQLRERAFKRLQELSFSYYDRTPAGWIMSRLTSDCQKVGDTIAWGLVDMVWGSAMMVGIMIFLLAMEPGLALITLSTMPVLVVVTFWFQKRILEAQRKARKTNSLLSGVFNEGLQGSRTSKTLVLEGQLGEEFRQESSNLRSYSIRAAKLSSLFLPLVIFLSASGAALTLGAGGTWIIKGIITAGTLVAFLNYAMMLFDPAREVARVMSEFQAAQASAERLLSLIETKPEIVDRPDVLAYYGDAHEPRTENWENIEGEVRFRKVSFRYGALKEGEKPEESQSGWIFKDFDLDIPAGQTLAVVGETGSGKSTLVNLLCRFYEPTSGNIEIDGRDYRERSQHWLHSRLGYVLQSPLLFAGSIRENIRYGRLDASDQEVEMAAEQANAMGFIGELEGGLDTFVGEGGVLLSTGQKQLISVARALLADPRIMILDEATSSIDTEAEVLIQGAVDRLLKDRTSIVIAHRLSTVRNADRIIVLSAGSIIEDGNHQALMEARGTYWRLYTRQFLDEEAVLEASRV